MNIAIIGMGLSGLATGWFLLNQFQCEKQIRITFFDGGAGGGTSGMAAGLLHPFAGASAKLNREGFEGYSATCKLLKIAEERLGKSVVNCRGLLRLATTARQQEEYYLSSKKYTDVIWFETTENKIPGAASYPGLYIPNSLGVDCRLYLKGLQQACEEMGAEFEFKKISSLDELKNFDQVVLATGAFVNQLLKEKLPVACVKGQMIEIQWPHDLSPLPVALNSHAYLIMGREKKTCLAGATYERNFISLDSDINFAKNDILPKIAPLVPALKDQHVIDCRAGLRASTPDHLPIIKQIDKNCWAITGMGSKGLLYHALYGERLAKLIVESQQMN